MSEPIADQVADIATRLKEIEEERRKERQAAEPPPEPASSGWAAGLVWYSEPLSGYATFAQILARTDPYFVWVPGMAWPR